MRPKDTSGSEVYVPFWTKKKGDSGLAVDEKEQTWYANSCRATEKQGNIEGSSTNRLLFFFQGDAKVMMVNFKQVFLSELLKQVRRRVRVSF